MSRAGSELRIGYVGLSDAAPLLVAEEHGLFARHGVSVLLVQMPGWAAVRDGLAVGALHGAHMLSPMAISTTLGLGGVQSRIAVVSTLSVNGNAITLGNPVWTEIADTAPELIGLRPLPAKALARVAASRAARGGARLRLAAVFSFSSHHYQLRDWLASGGIDPDRDVELVVVPPSLAAGMLARGEVDGFCAGEPWGSHAVDLGAGRIALAASQRWPGMPEKVLGMSARVLDAEPHRTAALVAALMTAGRWLDEPANHAEATQILAARALDLPEEIIALGLAGSLVFVPGDVPTLVPGPVFGTTFPHPAHGEGWLDQMRRWRHVPAEAEADGIWTTGPWHHAASILGETHAVAPPTWPALPADAALVAREDA